METEVISWEAIKNGDREAFCSLYNQYSEFLFGFGMKLVSDRELVAETIQNFFIYLYEKRSKLSTPKSLKTYLYISFRRMLLVEIKKQRELENTCINADLENYNFSIEIDFEQALEETEYKEDQLRRLQDALDELSPQQREIIYLKYYKNINNKEIAEMIHIKEQVVRNVAHIALEKLRSMNLRIIVISL